MQSLFNRSSVFVFRVFVFHVFVVFAAPDRESGRECGPGRRRATWLPPLPHRHRLTYLYFPVSVFVLQHLGYFSIAMPCNRYLGVWCWNRDLPLLFYPPHRGNTRTLYLQFFSNPVSIFPQFISSIEIHPDVCSTIRKYSWFPSLLVLVILKWYLSFSQQVAKLRKSQGGKKFALTTARRPWMTLLVVEQ